MQRPGSARTLRPKPGRHLDRQEQLSIIHPVGERRPTKPAPEQQAGYRHHRQMAGSSLRVRGTAGMAIKDAGTSRVIPACAGNSSRARAGSPRRSGHPCVCGEQASPLTGTRAPTVSSLRVRGTVRAMGCELVEERVIPACAGNRLRTDCDPTVPSCHPCVCGEQSGLLLYASHQPGSSPRVRGAGKRSGAQ